METRLLAVQHEDDCPPGWFGEWFAAYDVTLDVICGHRGDPIPESTSGYDGLLVLGGEMGAYDDVRCPWLPATRRLIARAVEDQTPFLGVCLGHQLAAAALGGAVARNPAGGSVGLVPVGLTNAGRDDSLLGVVAPERRAVQWNDDIVTALPPGGLTLAEAPDGSVQAARFGELAWGVQFHPEVSPEIVGAWARKAATSERAGVAAAVEAAREELSSAWRPLAERFAAVADVAAR